MRSNINFALVCAECGETLEASDSSNETKFDYPSAHDISAKIAIKPCQTCFKKIKEPLGLMTKAFKLINNRV